MKTGAVILCHGSRGLKAVREVPEIMEHLVTEVSSMLPSGIIVAWGALQFNQPDLNEAVATLIKTGTKRIIVMPYFLFSGNHITEDIPEAVDELKKQYPECMFVMTKPMGMESTFPSYIAQRIRSAVPDLYLDPDTAPIPISPIEIESMEIIDSLLPDLPGISEKELTVIKRIVHATGDPDISALVRFHPKAIDSGVTALVARKPVYTDVKMVQAGISQSMLNRFGSSVHCILSDSESMNVKPAEGQTRSAAAFHYVGEKLNGAIVAIGNAPTALFAMLELVDSGVTPALVIGMPVGFVQAKESKQALETYDIPYITIAGNRGGSPTAAATVNALLRLAMEKIG
ncbi:MAG: precorrin-8X methylmutase [Dehalococcoidales bacterium]|nr:precorrin-8X methylmutase [Dehalococcoidales bacterium]